MYIFQSSRPTLTSVYTRLCISRRCKYTKEAYGAGTIGIAGIEPTLLIRINSIESPNPLDHIPTYTEEIELNKIAF